MRSKLFINNRVVSSLLFFLVAYPLHNPQIADACDLHTMAESLVMPSPEQGDVGIGMSQQFTYYDRTKVSGRTVPNLGHQHLASSITQVSASYGLMDRVALHGNIPYINRRYRRVQGGESERGTERGVGDASLLISVTPIMHHDDQSEFFLQIFGGVKMPTGDSDLLNSHSGDHHSGDPHAESESSGEMDEHHHDHPESHHHSASRHAGHDHGDEPGVPSAIHGHDLALGSGSRDIPLGLNVFYRWDRVQLFGDVQYTFRNEGDYGYTYADDVTWRAGPGYFFLLEDDQSFALRVNFSGEYKGKDTVNGVEEQDTRRRSVFLGPRVVYAAGSFIGDFGVDLPIDIDNSGFQVVADYRLRLGLSYRL